MWTKFAFRNNENFLNEDKAYSTLLLFRQDFVDEDFQIFLFLFTERVRHVGIRFELNVFSFVTEFFQFLDWLLSPNESAHRQNLRRSVLIEAHSSREKKVNWNSLDDLISSTVSMKNLKFRRMIGWHLERPSSLSDDNSLCGESQYIHLQIWSCLPFLTILKELRFQPISFHLSNLSNKRYKLLDWNLLLESKKQSVNNAESASELWRGQKEREKARTRSEGKPWSVSWEIKLLIVLTDSNIPLSSSALNSAGGRLYWKWESLSLKINFSLLFSCSQTR